MSSWCNRNVLRKRDLSQIPEDLRPVILPRYQQPQVLLSETFQVKDTPKNEIMYPNDNDTFIDKMFYPKSSIPMKQIEKASTIRAIELKTDDKSYVFVILRNLQTVRDNDLWISSYNSIRKFYTNKIIIIDDNSTINTVNGKLLNTEIIKSEFNGAGEILPYVYFLNNKWADRMIFLHDSMFLHRTFTQDEVDTDIRFHWYFEPNNLDNQKKIRSYLSSLKNNEQLMEYTEANEKSRGCFGATCIIDYSIVKQLEDKYGCFTQFIIAIRNRKDRELFERIFAKIVYAEQLVNDENCSNFGNILLYPDAFESMSNTVDKATHNIIQSGYNTAIIKVWRGR